MKFGENGTEISGLMSAEDLGFGLVHDNLISDNAVMLLMDDKDEESLIIHNYGNLNVSEDNIISIGLNALYEQLGMYYHVHSFLTEFYSCLFLCIFTLFANVILL